MENKLFKSLSVVILAVLFRSLYLHQDFYNKMWEENQITILFLGVIFIAFIFLAIKFQKFEKVNND